MGPDTIDTAGLAPAGGDRRACIALVAHDHK